MGPSDTEAPFLDLDLSITGGIVSTKICGRRDDYCFGVVGFPFLGGDSFGVYILQLVRFARVCSPIGGFSNGNGFLAAGFSIP